MLKIITLKNVYTYNVNTVCYMYLLKYGIVKTLFEREGYFLA